MYITDLSEAGSNQTHSTRVAQSEYEIPIDGVWEVDRDKLHMGPLVGEGEFGVVKRGCATDITEVGVSTPVAIKLLKGVVCTFCTWYFAENNLAVIKTKEL